MKRTLAIILVALFVASCAFAATSTKFSKYGKIFKSGEYTLSGTSYTILTNGSKSGETAVTVSEHAGSYCMKASEKTETFRIIIADGFYYLISDAERSILKMDASEDDTDDTMTFPETYEVFSSGNDKLDGKSYYYEKTKEDDGTITTYWYKGNDLYAIQYAGSIFYITSVVQKTDASLFNIPSDYEVMDLSGLFSSDDEGSSEGWDFGLDDYDWDALAQSIGDSAQEYADYFESYDWDALAQSIEDTAQEYADSIQNYDWSSWFTL